MNNAIADMRKKNETVEEARPIVDFDKYSRDAWYVMTNKYRKNSISKIKLSVDGICKELLMARTEIMVY